LNPIYCLFVKDVITEIQSGILSIYHKHGPAFLRSGEQNIVLLLISNGCTRGGARDREETVGLFILQCLAAIIRGKAVIYNTVGPMLYDCV